MKSTSKWILAFLDEIHFEVDLRISCCNRLRTLSFQKGLRGKGGERGRQESKKREMHFHAKKVSAALLKSPFWGSKNQSKIVKNRLKNGPGRVREPSGTLLGDCAEKWICALTLGDGFGSPKWRPGGSLKSKKNSFLATRKIIKKSMSQKSHVRGHFLDFLDFGHEF